MPTPPPITSDGFDWSQGRWTNHACPPAEAEIVIAGDWAPIRAFDAIVAATPMAVYGDVLPVLRHSDLRIVNLECTLFGEGAGVWKSGSVFKGRPEHIHGLTAVPFDVVTLGNNHVFDYGTAAFASTQALLAEKGIRATGAGMSPGEARQPLIIDLKGLKLGIVNFSEGEDLTAAVDGPGVFGWEVDRAVDIVRTIRETVDIVLVICHAGVEYIAFPPPYVCAAFQRLADAGAHLIIGHHPHVPQGIQIYHGVPICYSLGNFIFYQETNLIYRKLGYVVKAGLAKGALTHIDIVPYEIGATGLGLLKDERHARFFEALRMVSLPLAQSATIRDAWHGFLRYYGHQGFRDEIEMLLAKMAQEPPKGAAMFRNRIATMQHNQHWIDALTRIMDDTITQAPQWAYDLHAQWLTRTREQGM